MTTLKTSLLLAGLLAFSGVHAQTTQTTPTTPPGGTTAHTQDPKAAQAMAKIDQIEQTAKADKKACEGMKGNAQDICQAEAKAKEKVAKAEVRFQQSGSERDRVNLGEMKAEAAYEVAKEKCEDQQGDAQKACKAQAKATEKAARAEAKKSAGKS
jgi:hypothetical protein